MLSILDVEVLDAHAREEVYIDAAYIDSRTEILRGKLRGSLNDHILHILDIKHKGKHNGQKYR